MKIIDTKRENNKITLTIEADANTWVKELDKTKKQLGKSLSIPGFRKGHAPQKIIDQSISTNQVISSTLDKFINELANEFILNESTKHKDIIPNSLKIDLKTVNDKNLILLFEFEKEPNIELVGYDKINFNYHEPTVSEKEINVEFKNAIKNDFMLSPKEDGIVSKGDMVKFDFDGFVDNKPIDGGKANDYQLEIGSGLFIPGFEEQMIGLKKGDKKSIEVTFPKDYPSKKYSNKKAKFNLLIKEVDKITYPKIDKAYLSKFKLPNIENEAQFKEYLRKEIIRVKASNKKQELIKMVNDFVIKNTKCDYLPDFYINSEIKAIKKNYEQQAKSQFKKNLDDAVVDLGYKSMDDFNKKIHEQAIDNIKFTLGMDKLIKLLDVKITPQDVKKEIVDSSKKFNIDANELLKNQSIVSSIRQYVLNDKIVTKLLEINNKKSNTTK